VTFWNALRIAAIRQAAAAALHPATDGESLDGVQRKLKRRKLLPIH
jgi:hypothetical protein